MPKISAEHLAGGGASGKYEPQRQNNWTFEVSLGDGSAEELIALAIDVAFEPNETTEEGEMDFWNEKSKFAGKTTYDSQSITVKDFVDVPVRDALLKWRREVYSPVTGKTGLAKNYKKDAYIKLYGPDGTEMRAWLVKNCWPAAVNWNSTGLDYSGSEVVKIELTIAFDRALWFREPETNIQPGVRI